jgi:uncharacterized membrane protein
MSSNIPTQPQALEEPRTLTHVLYALHTVTWFSGGVFSVIAIIINMIKFPDLPNDFYRSHWRWQSRTFWFALIGFVVTFPLWLVFVFPGWIAWTLIGLWYLYRCVRGWINFSDGRAMPLQETAR